MGEGTLAQWRKDAERDAVRAWNTRVAAGPHSAAAAQPVAPT